jgi:hypothetical protein
MSGLLCLELTAGVLPNRVSTRRDAVPDVSPVLLYLAPQGDVLLGLVWRHRDVRVVVAPEGSWVFLSLALQADVLRDRGSVSLRQDDQAGAAPDVVRFPAGVEACRDADGFRVCPADYRYCLDVHETRVADERLAGFRLAGTVGATLAASAADTLLGQTIRQRYTPTRIRYDIRGRMQAPTQPNPIPSGTRSPATPGSSSFQSSSLPKRCSVRKTPMSRASGSNISRPSRDSDILFRKTPLHDRVATSDSREGNPRTQPPEWSRKCTRTWCYRADCWAESRLLQRGVRPTPPMAP